MIITLGDSTNNILTKDAINRGKVKLMFSAVDKIQQMDAVTINNMLNRFQKQTLDDVILQQNKAMKSKKSKMADIAHFRFLCKKCECYACDAADIRVLCGAHHVVLAKEFPDRMVYKPHPKRIYIAEDLFMTDMMYCKGCNAEWGVKCVYDKVEVPLLKQKKFWVEDEQGKKTLLKKWGDVPFAFQDIATGEIEEYVQ